MDHIFSWKGNLCKWWLLGKSVMNLKIIHYPLNINYFFLLFISSLYGNGPDVIFLFQYFGQQAFQFFQR